MSDLNKFEHSESWFNQLKIFLLKERASVSHSKENNNQISELREIQPRESFIKVLEEKKNHISNSEMSQNKENMPLNLLKPKVSSTTDKTVLKNKNLNKIYSSNHNESTFIEEPSMWRRATDESFEFYEEICDETLTVYKKNSVKKNSLTAISLADTTQLNDIEAPSAIWENSIQEENQNFKTSPVKMIGLLRPSTILEESGGDMSVETVSSGSTSFQTVPKMDDMTSESEQFQSANESAKTDIKWQALNYNSRDQSEDSLENTSNIPKRKIYYRDPEPGPLYSSRSRSPDSLGAFSESNNSKSSSSLLDKSLYRSHHTDIKMFEDNLASCSNTKLDNKVNSNIFDPEKSGDSSKVIEISEEKIDLEDEDSLLGDNHEENSDLIDLSNDSPYRFNDTLEEVDHIMQKAMELVGASKLPSTLLNSVVLTPRKTLSPIHKTPKTPKTPSTVKSKPLFVKTASPFDNVNKEPTHFKMPISSRVPPTKSNSSLKKPSNFQHIISPIGAYIKNTPIAPTMTSSKPKYNLKESKVIKGLEFESRQPSPLKHKDSEQKSTCSLPSKAYIASEFKHYVDKRTPFKIPGGNKIHKYLEPAKIPAVVKHDGRLKFRELYSGDNMATESNSKNKTVDSSLADLSVVSGDVSLLTIKDAQKFGKK